MSSPLSADLCVPFVGAEGTGCAPSERKNALNTQHSIIHDVCLCNRSARFTPPPPFQFFFRLQPSAMRRTNPTRTNHRLVSATIFFELGKRISAVPCGRVSYAPRPANKKKHVYFVCFVTLSARRCPVTSSKGFRDSVALEAALEHRAFRLLRRVESRLRRDAEEGRTSSEAWNRALVEVRRCGEAGSHDNTESAFYVACCARVAFVWVRTSSLSKRPKRRELPEKALSRCVVVVEIAAFCLCLRSVLSGFRETCHFRLARRRLRLPFG